MERGQPSSADAVFPSPSALAPVLAPRRMFFTIQPVAVDRAADEHRILPLPWPLDYNTAIDRINTQSDHLTGEMRSCLTSTLTVLHRDFPTFPGTDLLTKRVVDPLTTPEDLLHMADQISHGLIAFLAKGGRNQTAAERPIPTKTKSSRRSSKIRLACCTRDNTTCALCRIRNNGVSCHIIPFSISGSKSLDFWAFVALFLGEPATSEFKAAALDPDPACADNIMNVVYLCHNCHALFDDSKISLIPTVLTDPLVIFPYDPRVVASYTAVVEFPFGAADVDVAVKQPTGGYASLQPGHTIQLSTMDPATRPLPHPLLLQLHAVVSRVLRMKAAAGYPVFPPSWEWGSECDEEDVALAQGNAGPVESDDSTTTFVDAWLQTDETVVSPGDDAMEEVRKPGMLVLAESEFCELPRSVHVVHAEHGARMEERRGLMLRRLGH